MRLLSIPAAPVRRSALFAGVLALTACAAPSTDAPVSASPAPEAASAGGKPGAATAPDTAEATPVPGAASPVGLADRVWRVRESATVEPGTTYAFLADGTLVVDSPNGTPMYGRWTHRGGGLDLTEEGVSYRTQILAITRDRLRLRSHNPGEPVEMTLEPVPGAELPPPRPAAKPGGAR